MKTAFLSRLEVVIVLLFMISCTAKATTLLVTNNNDSGAGSLRQAILDNESLGGNNTITFSNVTGKITLTSGELLITKNVTMFGPGSATLAVAGGFPNNTNRVLHITNASVNVSGLTITNGHIQAPSSPFPGNSAGGIYNDHATLTLNNCNLIGNSSGFGGCVLNDGGNGSAILTMSNCVLSGNSAGAGGGIYNYGLSGSAMLTIIASAVSSNSGPSGGGGIYNDHGTAKVIASTLRGNSGFDGGGILNTRSALTVSNCTISGNSASSLGGGVYSEFGTLTVIASTLSGNSASSGGGIYNSGSASATATLLVVACTISSNSASSSSGGIFNAGAGGTATLEIGSTILKTGAAGANIGNFGGSVISDGYNLSSDSGSGVLTNAVDQINTDPMLGSLADNGGPTFTHALLPGSPAIDKGKSFGLTADQRGAPRPFDFSSIANAAGGDGSDIGAFELASPNLNIQRAGGSAVLLWPSYYGDFSLQSSTNLTSSNSWITAVGSRVVVGGQYEQTNGPMSGNLFFRLREN